MQAFSQNSQGLGAAARAFLKRSRVKLAGTFDTLHPLAPPGMRLYMGGDKDPDAHFRGQEQAWVDVLRFLAQSLDVDAETRERKSRL